MGYLKHDTRAVAGTSVSTFRATMAHVFKYFQCIVYQLVAFVTVDIYHHTDTTRIVFVFGIIQSICHI